MTEKIEFFFVLLTNFWDRYFFVVNVLTHLNLIFYVLKSSGQVGFRCKKRHCWKTLIDLRTESCLRHIFWHFRNLILVDRSFVTMAEHDMGPETLTLSRGNHSSIGQWHLWLLILDFNFRCQKSLWVAWKVTKKQILWRSSRHQIGSVTKSPPVWISQCCQRSLWTCLWDCWCPR